MDGHSDSVCQGKKYLRKSRPCFVYVRLQTQRTYLSCSRPGGLPYGHMSVTTAWYLVLVSYLQATVMFAFLCSRCPTLNCEDYVGECARGINYFFPAFVIVSRADRWIGMQFTLFRLLQRCCAISCSSSPPLPFNHAYLQSVPQRVCHMTCKVTELSTCHCPKKMRKRQGSTSFHFQLRCSQDSIRRPRSSATHTTINFHSL